jgi:hypothetical protein
LITSTPAKNGRAFFSSVPFDTKYETVLNALEDAKSHALAGGDCAIYKW